MDQVRERAACSLSSRCGSLLRLRALVILALLVSMVGVAHAGNPYAYQPVAVETTRAYQYAQMSDGFCLAELRERKVPFERVDALGGIALPIRLTGKLRGVAFKQQQALPLGSVLDCRLALALDDFAAMLAGQDVVEVGFISLYRPGRKQPGVRHPAGRAIDVTSVKLKNKRTFTVHNHFLGKVGHQTCGRGAAPPRIDHRGARKWRSIVCQLDAMRSFNLILTPNYDRGHRDHLHLEVRSGIRWFLTQ